MGKSSRAKRRAPVRSAKRTRSNVQWYVLTGVIVLVGVVLVAISRPNSSGVGPQPSKDHWHAALGVYDCDHWMGDSSGPGLWVWPGLQNGQIFRVDDPGVYAGMHSHDDGIIHMEPQSPDEAGKNATIGTYFRFGGWKASSSGYSFLGSTVGDGGSCGGKPGALQWETAHFDGNVSGAQRYQVRTGSPGDYKLFDDDVVVIAFLPRGASIASIGNPPSLKNLPGALHSESNAMPPNTVPPNTVPPNTVPPNTVPPNTVPPNTVAPTSEPTTPATTPTTSKP